MRQWANPVESTLSGGNPLPQELKRPRVLIADDDAGVRTAVARLLSLSCEVVGYVVDSATLFDVTVQLRADVVLLDLSIPGGNVFEACRRLRRVKPEVKVIAFTAHHDEDTRRAAYEAGCSAFVWKLKAADELLREIQVVIDGVSRSADGDTA